MRVVEAVIAKWIEYIGYKEKKSNSQLDDFNANAGSGNYTKFGRDLDAVGYFNTNKNGAEWCAVTYHAMLYYILGKAVAQKITGCGEKSCAAGCRYGATYYKAIGKFHKTNPKRGDQIFFGNESNIYHTGIVEKVENGKVYTIEGNSNNQLMRHDYAVGYSNIYGYGTPDWDYAEKEYDKLYPVKTEEKKPYDADTPILDDVETYTTDNKPPNKVKWVIEFDNYSDARIAVTEVQKLYPSAFIRRYG